MYFVLHDVTYRIQSLAADVGFRLGIPMSDIGPPIQEYALLVLNGPEKTFLSQ